MTVLFAVIAFSCSSDIVELLPLTAGASNGGSAGQDTVASGASPGGSGAGGRSAGGSAGSMSSQGGSAGAPQAGGGNGGAGGGGCFGFGCAGESGFGGSFGGPPCGFGNSCEPCANDDTHCPSETEFCADNVCVQCTIEGPSQCWPWPGGNCDVLVHRCAPACDDGGECNDGRVCDVNQGTCVWCVDKGDCGRNGDPRSICYLHRCVECTQDPDCTEQGKPRCSGNRCVQCLTNKDCLSDGKTHCDVPKGYCE
jgi:hypothetical protein